MKRWKKSLPAPFVVLKWCKMYPSFICALLCEMTSFVFNWMIRSRLSVYGDVCSWAKIDAVLVGMIYQSSAVSRDLCVTPSESRSDLLMHIRKQSFTHLTSPLSVYSVNEIYHLLSVHLLAHFSLTFLKPSYLTHSVCQPAALLDGQCFDNQT